MTFGHAIRRIWYYMGDTPTLLRAFFTYLRAYFLTPDSRLLEFANPGISGKPGDMERIRDCVGLCFRFGDKIGLNNTCLIHSVVLCRLLNRQGFNASVVFAAKKNENSRMIGHCWVNVNNTEINDNWHVIFNHP